MAEIHPPPGDFADVANLLLELADSPHDVATTTNGPSPLGLVVPEALYERYLEAVGETADPSTESSDQDKPKKRGRPRKNAATEQEPTP